MTEMSPNNSMPFRSSGGPTAASIVRSLTSAFHNFALYDRGHVLSIQSITKLVSDLTHYTETTGPLSLDIGDDGFYDDGIPIGPVQGKDDALVHPLTRDGIYHLDFLKGIDKKEIGIFFDIIRNNKTLSDKPEGDTVTDLWKADLRYIHYKATDIYWDREPVFMFPNPTLGEPAPLIERSFRRSSKKKKKEAPEPDNGTVQKDGKSRKLRNLDGPHFTEEAITLTPDDWKHLHAMVKAHEFKRTEDEILNLMLLVIDEISRSDDLENVLANLSVEFHRILKNGDIDKAYDIIETVKEFQRKHNWTDSSSERKISDFLAQISGPVFMDSYPSLVPLLNRNKSDEITVFKKLCMALDPAVVLSLCEVIVYLESQTSKDFLMDLIKIKTREDVAVIERMLESTDKMIALIGVSLLKNLKDANSDMLLHRMLKHPVEQVRSSALDFFVDKPLTVLPRIFFLIDDPSDDVRNKVLKFIGSRRNIHSESMMLDYLQELSHYPSDRDHVLLCYKVLGQCGSERSIPFLKKKLFSGALMDRNESRSFNYRLGALLALKELKHAEASKVLARASKSRFQSVVKAYQTIFDAC